jgi:hypothetical protein
VIINVVEKHAASTFKKEVTMEAASSSEELVTTHQTKWCHDTQNYNPNIIQKLVLSHISLYKVAQKEHMFLKWVVKRMHVFEIGSSI